MADVNSRINLNTATADELEGLNGVGPALARAIIEFREESGLLLAIDDLVAVKGIGLSLVDRIRGSVTLAGSESAEEEAEPPEAPVAESDLLDEERFQELVSAESVQMSEVKGVEPPETEAAETQPAEPALSVSEESEGAAVAPPIPHESEAEMITEPVEDAPEPEPATELAATPPVTPQPAEKQAPPAPAQPAERQARRTREEDYHLPPPLEIVEPARGRLTFWKGLLMVLLGTLLGGALALGVVWLLNGTLDFAAGQHLYQVQAEVAQSRADRASITRQLGDLDEKLNSVRTDLTSMPQVRADIEQLNAKIGGIGGELDAVRVDVAGLHAEVGRVDGDIAILDEQTKDLDNRLKDIAFRFEDLTLRVEDIQAEMDAIAGQAERFDAFLAGLQALLRETAPTE